MDSKALIAAYYDAFNAGRTDEMLTYLHDEVEHHVNEGGIRRGKDKFRDFNAKMTESYHELPAPEGAKAGALMPVTL